MTAAIPLVMEGNALECHLPMERFRLMGFSDHIDRGMGIQHPEEPFSRSLGA